MFFLNLPNMKVTSQKKVIGMVNAINTTQQNIYTSGVQYTSGANNYTSIANEGLSTNQNNEEVKDSSIVSDYIVEQQNEVFSIQINTQNGIALVNTTQSAVDDMQSVLAKLKEKLNTLSNSSTMEEIAVVQGEVDELLSELYDIKNGAKFDGKLIFGEYDEKPGRLSDEADENSNARYMEDAYFQIGYSTSENSVLEFSTVFDMGGFDIYMVTSNDLGSALGVCEAFEKDLAEYEKNLGTNKSLLVQNNESASEHMKKLISFEASPEMSDNMYVAKALAEIRATLVTNSVSQIFGFGEVRLAQIMTGIWGL